MDLTSALMAFGILCGALVVFVMLWDALLSPVVMFALKLTFYVALGAAAFALVTTLL